MKSGQKLNVLLLTKHSHYCQTKALVCIIKQDMSTSHPNGRQRVCHRMQREESLSSRRGVQNVSE